MTGKVTLQQVAKVAGVSRATVSLVVRQSPLVADRTRAMVEQVMADLDYVHNIGAARLRNNSSRTVGLIVPNLVNAFFTEFLAGVEDVMGQQDRVVLLANSHDSPAVQDQILNRFRGHGVDGVILCPAQGTDPALPDRLRRWGMPLVQALRETGRDNTKGGPEDTAQTDYAGADYITGVDLAVRHLVANGHRRIAFLSVTARTSARAERLEGFRRALAHSPAQSAGIVEAELTWEAAMAAADACLSLPGDPTAILCFNDVLAAGLMAGLRRAGIRPGRDRAVVGLDDLPLAQLTHPALTSVAMMPAQIGANAGRLLGARIAAPDAPTCRMIVAPHLIARDSSRHQDG